MTSRPSILVAALLAALMTGCGGGGGGGGPTAPPTQIDVNETEPNDFTAQNVGTLSALDFVVSGATSSARDVDLYLVKLASTTSLLVNLDWNSTADLELAVSDTVGIFVRNVDTAGHPESCKLPSLPAGNYTVRVGSFTNAATSYTLTLGQR